MTEPTSPGAETVGAMFDLKPARGASAEDASAVIAAVVEVPLHLIDPDPDNPRQTIDQKSIEQLAQSIDAEGLKQPITIRLHPTEPGRYMVSYGERRLRAFKSLGRSAIPAIIGTADGVRAGQLLENLQREGVRPLEEAVGIARLLNEERAEKGEIARRLGLSAAAISQYLKVASVGDDFLEEFRKRNLSLRSMYLLATAPVPVRIKLLKKSDADLTNKVIENAIKRDKDKASGNKGPARRGKASPENAIAAKAAVSLFDALDGVDPETVEPAFRSSLHRLRARIDELLGHSSNQGLAAE